MNGNILNPPVSTPIPTGVYDLESLQVEARHLNINPTYPNIRRLRRAFDIADNHRIRLFDRFGDVRIYEVDSQTRNLVHFVVVDAEVQCTCEDARKRRDFTGCKHSMAVQIYEDRLVDYEGYLQWLEERPL